MKPPLRCLALMGATATGKSHMALDLAETFAGEIVSMDSRQVYRRMDVGTGKIRLHERRGIAHHLIDIMDPDETNSAGLHAQRARRIVAEIHARGKLPILVGGTGFYFRALFHGLADTGVDPGELDRIRGELAQLSTEQCYRLLKECDPLRAGQLSPHDRLRITRALEVYRATGRPISEFFSQRRSAFAAKVLKIVLTMPRYDLRGKIEQRTGEMFAAGWVEEVDKLLATGYSPSCPGMNSIGYRQIAAALIEGTDPEATMPIVVALTRQYAKRQETFFRREPDARWLDVSRPGFRSVVEREVERFMDLKNDLT